MVVRDANDLVIKIGQCEGVYLTTLCFLGQEYRFTEKQYELYKELGEWFVTQ